MDWIRRAIFYSLLRREKEIRERIEDNEEKKKKQSDFRVGADEREFRRKSNNAAPFFFISMAAPVQRASAPPPTADVDEVIQMLIKDGKRRRDDFKQGADASIPRAREKKNAGSISLNLDLFFPQKHHPGTFDKLRRRLLEELASDAEVSARADEAVAAEMERRARVGSAGGERPGSASGVVGNGRNSSAAAVTAASFLAAPGARKEVVSRAAADAEDAVTAAALAAAWRILYKDKEGGGSEAAAAGEAQQEQQQGEERQPQPQPALPAPSPSLASEVELATERALRRLWDERDGVAAEGGGGG